VNRHAPPAGSSGSQTVAEVAYQRLHHVQLAIPAGGEDECRRFWGDLLGLTEVSKPPALALRGGCWFRGDGLEVHLGVEADVVAARKAHPGIEVTGLDALAARLTDGGVAVRWDGEFPGYRRFYADDPFGNRLEFLEPEAG
jgi:catechol 2,3-dioxygenase-like lactoylglutathione lyase family enzyme